MRFAIGTASLGVVGIAASEHGLRAIEIGDTSEHVRATLVERFSADGLVEDVEGLAEWLGIALAMADDPASAAALAEKLPLDEAGTEFQRAVWGELRRIEPGTTRTYAQVATALGRPSATRAVARACATNQLAIVTPCHRVVRSDGTLSGYRWGVERKRAILDRERHVSGWSRP